MKLCSISSGSSGNCIYVGSDSTAVLVDAGISGKRIEAGLNTLDETTRDISAILVTHEHNDHIRGLGVLARRYHLPIYGTAGTIQALKGMTALGKIPDELYHEIRADEGFTLGDLTIRPFRIYHDAAEPVAYRLSSGGRSTAVATDLGHYDDYIVGNLQGLDTILLESNHDVRMLEAGGYPYYLKRRILGDEGHLSNEESAQALLDVIGTNTKKVFLGHRSQHNNIRSLAHLTVATILEQHDLGVDQDFDLKDAEPDQPSKLLAL